MVYFLVRKPAVMTASDPSNVVTIRAAIANATTVTVMI